MSQISNLAPGDTVKALSIHEPFASLIARGAKTIETRSWATNYQGPMLICAARRKSVNELVQLFWAPEFRRGLGLPDVVCAPRMLRDEIDALPFGQAVALVELYECSSALPVAGWEPPAEELPFGDYSPGRHAWRTHDLRRLKPFPVTGRQGGLFRVTLPEDLEDWTP